MMATIKITIVIFLAHNCNY